MYGDGRGPDTTGDSADGRAGERLIEYYLGEIKAKYKRLEEGALKRADLAVEVDGKTAVWEVKTLCSTKSEANAAAETAETGSYAGDFSRSSAAKRVKVRKAATQLYKTAARNTPKVVVLVNMQRDVDPRGTGPEVIAEILHGKTVAQSTPTGTSVNRREDRYKNVLKSVSAIAAVEITQRGQNGETHAGMRRRSKAVSP